MVVVVEVVGTVSRHERGALVSPVRGRSTDASTGQARGAAHGGRRRRRRRRRRETTPPHSLPKHQPAEHTPLRPPATVMKAPRNKGLLGESKVQWSVENKW